MDSTASSTGLERRTFFGVVSVVLGSDGEPRGQGIRHLDVTTLGLRLDSGLTLGYLRDVALSVPADCRLVVFVKSPVQLEQAASVLGNITREKLCTATLPD